MCRPPLRSFVLLVVLLTALGSLGSAVAQDATPASEHGAGTPEAGTFREMASGSLDLLAPGTANLGFGRITLAPGATFPFDPTNPSVDLVYMTSGTLTFRVEAPMKVARGAKAGTPVAAEPEEIPAGTEFTLSDGDSAIFPPNTGGEVRNDSDQEATAWVTNVSLIPSAAATPTP
jgi:quercetin dioxygenase-like cupin family protein